MYTVGLINSLGVHGCIVQPREIWSVGVGSCDCWPAAARCRGQLDSRLNPILTQINSSCERGLIQSTCRYIYSTGELS